MTKLIMSEVGGLVGGFFDASASAVESPLGVDEELN